MELLSAFGVQGTLEIYTEEPKDHSTGERVRKKVFEQTNLVVTSAKEYIIKLLFDPNAYDGKLIDTLKIGTGGTWDPSGFYPKSEDPTQTDLTTPIKAVLVSPSHTSGTTAVTFLADVAQNDNSINGQVLSEAGLFRGNNGSITAGALFSIKNYPGIRKTEFFSVHYVWTIKLV